MNKINNDNSRFFGDNNGYEYIDLGLSVAWATCNIGANNPIERGLYFAWGETEGYEKVEDKKGGYSYDTLKYSTNSITKYFSKYNEDGGKSTLDLEDDAAHVNMGGDWRMPTLKEFQELLDNTNWGKTSYGFSFINKDNTTQLILPLSGMFFGDSWDYPNTETCYWTSSLFTECPSQSHCFMTYNGHLPKYKDKDMVSFSLRCLGFPIRGVLPLKLN